MEPNHDNPKAVAHAKFVFGVGNPNADIGALAVAVARKDADAETKKAARNVETNLAGARIDPESWYGRNSLALAIKQASDWNARGNKKTPVCKKICKLCGDAYDAGDVIGLKKHWCQKCIDRVSERVTANDAIKKKIEEALPDNPDDPMQPIYARARKVAVDVLDTIGTPDDAVVGLRIRIANRKAELANICDCDTLAEQFDEQLVDVLAMFAIEGAA